MIPPEIKAEHILAAIAEVDAKGVPAGRESSRYVLHHNDRRYPPKYLISRAAKFAVGRELKPDEFNGGHEANSFLRRLGFGIEEDGRMPAVSKPETAPAVRHVAPTTKLSEIRTRHDERCKDCKTAIRGLLERLYGPVEVGKRFGMGTAPQAFSASEWFPQLQRTFDDLRQARGFIDFVRSPELSGCDYFVPDTGFMIEFDESQHFTALRECALSQYSESMPLGFDRDTWIALCRDIRARDDNPPFRDEQRAWYDTLRDFLPTISPLLPTVRIYASEYAWCGLNPKNQEDVEKFRQILSDRTHVWKIDFQAVENPRFARLVMDGAWSGGVNTARTLLAKLAAAWPNDRHLKCLCTCGAFLRFDWPAGLARRGNLNPNPGEIEVLIRAAEQAVRRVLSDDVVGHLRHCCDYLTLGVDTKKPNISTTYNVISQPHAELVCVADVRKGTLHWTGKFYPTPQQEKTIIRYPNLSSHFVQLDEMSVMVLGCHDLMAYSPRGQAKAGGWRKEVSAEYRRLAQQQRPRAVLHHPHTSVKVGTWRQPWRQLEQELPSVTEYLGTGAYSYRDDGWDNRDELQTLLWSTQKGHILNVIVRLGMPATRATIAP